MENPVVLHNYFAEELRQAVTSAEKFPQDIAVQSESISRILLDRIKRAYYALSEEDETDLQALYRAYFINYYWSSSAKSFILLCRDILFEQQKVEILVAEGLVNAERRDQLHRDGKVLLSKAMEEIIRSEETAGSELGPKEIKHCKLQLNPSPVYQQQIVAIHAQIQKIFEGHSVLQKATSQIIHLRKELAHTIELCHSELVELRANLKEASQFIRQVADENQPKGPGKIAARMPEYQSSIQEQDYLKDLENKLASIYPEIPANHNLALGLQEGILLTDDVDFRRKTKQWVKSEILPLIYEIWELTDLRRRSAQITLINVRNWAHVLSDQGSSEENEVNFGEILVLFDDLETRTDKALTEMEQLHQMALKRLQEFLRAHRVFIDYRPFLPIEVDSTINRLRKGQNRFIRGIVDVYKTQAKRVKKFLRRLEREETLSNSEKIVRRIRERTGDPANQQYNSIFLTKGFVGTSFTVGRQEELSHAGQIVGDWEKGYRGSILITGERYSGKSLFSELIASRYFQNNTYRIEANSILTVAGRKFRTGHDLDQVLENIRKYKGSERCMLLVDDLETWWNDEISLHESAWQLARFANLYGSRFFLLVNLGNSLLAHLEQTVDICREFQSEINMDGVSAQMVREAILVRHGATHKKLVSDKNEVLTSQQFRRQTNAIYQESRGNIGEALNLWALSTWKVDEESVTNRFQRGHDLPDFLESDLGILLATVLLHRKANELQLRHIFGPAFSNRYAPVVRRLLGVGILRREINGSLEINPVLVNRLGQILESQGYLKYQS